MDYRLRAFDQSGHRFPVGTPPIPQRKFNERAKPWRIMKETFWSKLRELWAIRRRCQQIKLEQRQNRLPRSNESYGGTQRLAKIVLLKNLL
jgi:hypothetical protein